MKQLVVTFLFFCSCFLFSQSENQNTDQNLYLKTISKKSALFRKKQKLDSAIFYANRLLQESKLTHDSTYILKAYKKLSLYHKEHNKPIDAVKYYTYVRDFSLLVNDTISAINASRLIASIQKKLGDLNSSENTAISALKLCDNLSDSTATPLKLALYNHLGITTKELANYKDAIRWYKKALVLNKDTLKGITIKNNIAVIAIKEKQFNVAINSLSELLKLKILATNPKTKARIIDNLAHAKSKTNSPDAEKELLKALNIRKKIKDNYGLIASYMHLADHYKNNNSTEKALFYAEMAYKISKQFKNSASIVESLTFLLKLEGSSKHRIVEFLKLDDSLKTETLKAKNQFAKIRYRTEESRRENLILKAKNAKKDLALAVETNYKLWLIGLIVLLIGSGFFLNYYRKQETRIARIKERHATQHKLSKKLHDGLGNDIYHLMVQLKNNIDFTSKKDNLKILEGFNFIYHSVRDFSRNIRVETGPEYENEILDLLNSYSNLSVKTVISDLDRIPWTTIAAHKKEELYLVLKELLTNMNKHSNADFYSVRFVKNNKNITINYFDNGIGVNLNNGISKNGLFNAENRMKEIGGSITFESEPKDGFKATIIFAL